MSETMRRLREIERSAAEAARKSDKALAEIEQARQSRIAETKARLEEARSGIPRAAEADSDNGGFDLDSYIPGRATKEQTERLKVALKELRR